MRTIIAAISLALAISIIPAKSFAVDVPSGCWVDSMKDLKTDHPKVHCPPDGTPVVPLWRKAQSVRDCHYVRRHDAYESRYIEYLDCPGQRQYPDHDKRSRDDYECRPICTQRDQYGDCTHYRNPCR